MNRTVFTSIAILCLISVVFGLSFHIQITRAGGSIYIHPDGSVDPLTAPILNFRNMYYNLTDDLVGVRALVIERDNIVFDGAGHTIQGEGVGEGIDISNRSNVTIQNTKIKSFGHGVKLYYSSYSNIHGNSITDCRYSSISGYSSQHNSIRENNITNSGAGVYLYGSANHNSLFENNITENEDYGIWLDFSSYNTVHGNSIISNNGSGIRLRGASENSIHGNNVSNNECGIDLSSKSSDNIIYHNNFTLNTRQVYDASWDYETIVASTNTWDNGYPYGGNCWSHYTDIDQKSGPDQDLYGSDGIWDSPYIIDENNQDNYPIVTEFPSLFISSLFMIATLLGVLICMMRKTRTKLKTR